MMKSGIVLVLCMMVFPARAQQAIEILEKTSARYRNAQEYQLVGSMNVKMEAGGQQQAMEVTISVAERKPNLIRAEIQGPQVHMQIVSNGQSTWMYIPALNQYMQQKGAFDPNIAGSPMPDLVSEYTSAADNISEAKVLREEDVAYGVEMRPAYVIHASYTDRAAIPGKDETTKTLWVDKQEFTVLRDETVSKVEDSPFGGPTTLTEHSTYSLVTIGKPLPDSLFAFVPPATASEVKPEDVFGQKDGSLVGSIAQGFRLKSLAGEEVTLESLRGKVVLVNLWATWCGPCREEMPAIEALHKELAAKDLMVLAVDVAEEQAEVESYIKEHGYTFKVLLDPDGSVASQYRAEGIPTSIIIDREGRITHHFVGARPGSEFRDALKTLGIE